jgi:lipopolysaccharide/colanic/teichoic acid biosynthesis glycosyltransferase
MEETHLTTSGYVQSPRIRGRAVVIPEIQEPFLKRLLEMGLAGLGLLLSAPLWAVAALAVMLEDSGPVFFRQGRWGGPSARSASINSALPIPFRPVALSCIY